MVNFTPGAIGDIIYFGVFGPDERKRKNGGTLQ